MNYITIGLGLGTGVGLELVVCQYIGIKQIFTLQMVDNLTVYQISKYALYL